MEGSKLHSVQLQLSVIQNEKERLLVCLQNTIERAESLSCQPSAASRVMRDNAQLLSLLSEWADSAEATLPSLYPGAPEPHTVNGMDSSTAPVQPPGPQLPPPGLPGPSPQPGTAAGPRATAGSQFTFPAPGPVSTSSVRSLRPAAPDGNTTLDSAVSFHTAAVGGGSTVACSVSPVSQDRPDTAPAQQPAAEQPGGRSGSPRTEPTPPPLETRVSSAWKSSGEVSSIINRHLRKKKTTPEPPREVTQKRPPLGEETPVTFSYHDDVTGYTYLNLREDRDMLNRLTEQLTALALNPARVSRLPRQGELVMAAWQGAWYRARVTHVCDKGDATCSTVSLQYIDYGNSDQQMVGQIRFLPDKMKEAPAAAYKCKLVNLRVGGAEHWPLQRRVLLTLADSPESHLTAVFRPSPLPGLYELSLASVVTVAGGTKKADVVGTINKVLTMDAFSASRQAHSDEVELRPLLVQFVSPAPPPADPAVGAPEQPPEEKVRSWLAGQAAADSRCKTERKEATVRSRTSAGRGGKQAELNMSFASSGTRAGRPRRCKAPPEYSGLQLVWTARPLEQPLSGDGPHHVLMLHIYDPAHFYIGVRTELFDKFEERLTSVYSRLPLHPEQAVRHLLVPDSYWVAEYREEGAEPRWCRCVVLEEQTTAGDKDRAPCADFPVQWVDYGDTARLPAASFRPMTEEFAAEPLFAVRARCAGVYPVDELGAQADGYSSDAAEAFRGLLNGRLCTADLVPSESTRGCQAVVLEAMVDSDLLSVTSALLELGIAALRYPELDPSFTEPGEQEQAQQRGGARAIPPEELGKWNPMSEDYVSPYNRPGEDRDVEVAGMTGRGDSGEPPVCPVFARGAKCWDGIACKKRHVRGGDQLPARVPVHVSNTEPVVLPRLGATVYVKVSAVVSPQEFYVQLPFGAIPAQDVNSNHTECRRRLEEEETLESLSAVLSAAYGSSRRLDYSADCPPGLGEVLVAPWQRGWHRGFVTDLSWRREEKDRLSVQVFLVDHGHTLTCDAEELKEMKQEFNLLPYQAVRCSLGLVSPVGGAGWSEEAVSLFVRLVGRPCLLATVLSRSDSRLELDLYERRRPLAQALVKAGLAVLNSRQVGRPQPPKAQAGPTRR